jgi:CBF1 interacting corepressor
MGDEKARLGLSFMYNAPTSLKDQKQDSNNDNNSNEVEVAGPSGSSNSQSKNIRCLKCKRIGHANTDKSCPLYGKSRLDVEDTLDEESVKLTLQEPDFKPPKPVESNNLNSSKEESLIANEEKDDDLTLDMLRNLSKKEKKVLLKRLKRLTKKIKKSL